MLNSRALGQVISRRRYHTGLKAQVHAETLFGWEALGSQDGTVPIPHLDWQPVVLQMDAPSDGREPTEHATSWLDKHTKDASLWLKQQPARVRIILKGCWALKWQPWKWVPLWNLVYDLMFDEPPAPENVEHLLNAFGLVTALLLGSVFGVLGSVDMEELIAVDQVHFDCGFRGSGNQILNRITGTKNLGYQRSMEIYFAYTMSVISISSSLFATVVVIMAFSSHDFSSDRRAFKAWWFFGRWAIAFIFVTMLMGCYASFYVRTPLTSLQPVGCVAAALVTDAVWVWCGGIRRHSLSSPNSSFRI